VGELAEYDIELRVAKWQFLHIGFAPINFKPRSIGILASTLEKLGR
jgi:hypothetical protein